MLREIWKTQEAIPDHPVDRARVPARDTPSPADRDLALVEAALRLHDRALPAGGHPEARLAAHLGGAPSTIGPCMVVLTGKPADRACADPAALGLTLAPGATTGWRSECVVRPETGGTVRVELVTAPPVAAPGVTHLYAPPQHGIGARADGPVDAQPGAGGRHAARTAALHRLGQVDRDHSDSTPLAPDLITALGAAGPASGPAPSALAALWALFAAAEAEVPLHPRFPPAPCLRRLHVFARIDRGMACAVTSTLIRGAPHAPATHSIRSSMRRLDDGATLAVCETVLR